MTSNRRRQLSIRKKPSAARQTTDSLTIVLISDTHELHREIEVPAGDILIHAGDFTMNSRSAEKLIDFNEWLGEVPHAHRVVIPGNHDSVVEDASRRALITNATLLINASVEIMGLKFWGSPATPLLGEAFGVVSDTARAKVYSLIPADTDILVTHGPPYGILDKAPGSDRHEGCHQLFAAVQTLKPMLHVFGHVHGAYGTYRTDDTLFVNAALPGRGFGMSNRPHVFRLPRR
jgi:Icc-related predicted phosphoesterase